MQIIRIRNRLFKYLTIIRFLTLSNFLFQLDPSKMDRVELAFRKFDTNNDGYLTRDEFDVVS